MIDILDDNLLGNTPDAEQLQAWAAAALDSADDNLSIRIVDVATMKSLNHEFRDKPTATNVLSFPAEMDTEMAGLLQESASIGDIAICAEIVEREAEQQGKSLDAHWAHMVVHGVLHLRGFDHILNDQAETMETLETSLLLKLGFADPYSATDMGASRVGNSGVGCL